MDVIYVLVNIKAQFVACECTVNKSYEKGKLKWRTIKNSKKFLIDKTRVTLIEQKIINSFATPWGQRDI